MPWPEPSIGNSPAAAGFLTAAVMGALIARAFRVARKALRRLRFEAPPEIVTAFQQFRARHLLWLAMGFVLCLTFCGWGWAVEQWFGGYPGTELVLLAPFLIAWITSWLASYRVERELALLGGHEPLGLRDYMTLQFRRQLALATIPIALVILQRFVTRTWPQLDQSPWFVLATFVILLGVVAAAPWLLRPLLGLKSLPPSPLRARLEATARRLKFRYSDLLLWNTHGQMANAMVAGLLPRPRCVLFTDLLLKEMSTEEVEAVLGHEAGHVRYAHLTYYFAFLAMSLLALQGFANMATPWLHWAGEWQSLPLLLVTGAVLIFAFGFVSRRCEREADLVGCKAVSCGKPQCIAHTEPLEKEAELCHTGIEIFVNSLERVADANGISRSNPGWLSSWQHGTIANRVAFLEAVRQQPELARQFQFRLRWFRLLSIWVLFFVIAALMYGGYLTTAQLLTQW
jgi:Zn-dependent protease with chaperone function